ncbi:MAG TPA: hypothetical protein VKD28_10215 [Gemmatimonadales bacterium]|nr:hypothetical protein [Gemmatimonadales bacterium]
MPPLARSVGLFVAFFLLGSFVTAYAECAWVLWTRVFGPDPTAPPEMLRVDPWSPIYTLGSRQECADLLRQMAYQFDVGGGYHQKMGNRTWQAVCLPDTVDPRGPKGAR